MKTLLISSALTLLSANTLALENITTTCNHGAQTRVIEVVYRDDSQLPCEVQYTKETGTETLWSAQNLEGYCEEKAAAFVEKQQSWGWECSTAGLPAAVESVTETAVEADTETAIESDTGTLAEDGV